MNNMQSDNSNKIESADSTQVPEQQNIGTHLSQEEQKGETPAVLSQNPSADTKTSDSQPTSSVEGSANVSQGENYEKMPPVSVIHDETGKGESAYIVRDHNELLKMMEAQNMFSGQRPRHEVQMELAEAAKNNGGEEEVKRVVLPADKFQDFKEVNKDNEEEFEYVISCIVIQFLEKFQDTALEFPSCIDGTGRA